MRSLHKYTIMQQQYWYNSLQHKNKNKNTERTKCKQKCIRISAQNCALHDTRFARHFVILLFVPNKIGATANLYAHLHANSCGCASTWQRNAVVLRVICKTQTKLIWCSIDLGVHTRHVMQTHGKLHKHASIRLNYRAFVKLDKYVCMCECVQVCMCWCH